MLRKLFYLVLAVAMLVSCAGGNREMVGAYSKPQRLTGEDKALFEAVVTVTVYVPLPGSGEPCVL